ncbi:hypothetical protein DAERI_030151 [Deinococcus aerius]|uniref:Uncharacterized protein n=1 Tax=Deinococcus aerius TaxID=200253 RepID=A0A2I9DWL1_9DEIO|nr:hypothetical protein [Deinococcus aerius]GBF04985.1 hypothetical protein DAERI_030151 [Deinococcus aerius]
MRRFSSFLALLTLSTALAQGTPAAPAPTPASLAAERELVRRALSFDFGPSEVETRLLVGQLPPQPLGPLPALPGSRVIGSVLRTSSAPDFPTSQNVYLDSPAAPAQVGSALQTSLTARGWTAFPRQGLPFAGTGFLPQEPTDFLSFYRLEEGVALYASLRRVGNVTQVGLNLSRNPNLRDQVRSEAGGGFPRPDLPALRPPEGTSVQPRGVGGGSGSWNSGAAIQSPLTATALLDFYAAQLKAAGWTPITLTPPGRIVTSVWRFTDEDKNEATGVLTLREDAPGRYSAQLSSFRF